MGCPCHIAHNAASNAADFLRKDTKFDVEELLIDIFFWFDKSTKRKAHYYGKPFVSKLLTIADTVNLQFTKGHW